MKNKIIGLVMVLSMLVGASISAQGSGENSETIRILLNNRFISCEQNPVIVEGRTLVPMRAIFEALGAEVNWDGDTRTATGVKDGRTVAVSIDKNEIVVDGTSKEIDVPAQIINDYTMIPVRAVAEAYDCIVSWNGYHRYVIISPANQKPYKIEAIKDGEVTGTAEFDSYGRLVKLTGSGVFDPFFININGNSYLDDFFRYDADILYDGNNIETIKYTFKNGDSEQRTFAYKDNLLIADDYVYGHNRYKYDDDICHIDDGYDENNIDYYKFNLDGLVETYTKYDGSLEWNDEYTYDETGKMLTHYNGGAGGNVDNFEYDDDGKLLYALSKYYTYTYKYIEQ